MLFAFGIARCRNVGLLRWKRTENRSRRRNAFTVIVAALVFLFLVGVTWAKRQEVQVSKADVREAVQEVLREHDERMGREYPDGHQVFGVSPEGFVVQTGEMPEGVKVNWETGRVEDFGDQEVTVLLPNIEFSAQNVKLYGIRVILPKYPLRKPFNILGVDVEVLALRPDLVVVGIGVRHLP